MRPEELCEPVLELIGERAEAEVMAVAGRSALTRFANSFVHQNVAEDYASVRLRVCDAGRQASGSTSRVDREGLSRLVESTLEAARLRPADPEWPGLAPAASAPAVDRYDHDTALASPSARAAVVKAFVDADPSLSGAGYCDTGGVLVAFANSAGQRLTTRYSQATIDGVQRTGTSDGVGWQVAARLEELDGSIAGANAAATARAAADPIEIEPGDYEVVLAPKCVADLVSFIAAYAFNAKAHAEGRSFAVLGENQFDAAVSLCDDVTDGRAIGMAFDAEGTPKRRVDLIDAGTTSMLLHDRRTAAAAGVESTGHAVAGGESWGPMPSNMFLAVGNGGTLSEMVAKVERGLLVSDFWYTRVLDPKTLVVTGLTRNGTFLVERGEVRAAVTNLRFTQSYAGALGPGNVIRIGGDGCLVDDSTFVPSLHLARWTFTGGASG